MTGLRYAGIGVLGIVVAFAGTQVVSLAEQGQNGQRLAAPATATKKPAKKLHTPWGDPNLQGIWSNATTTPLERPSDLEGKAQLSDAEHEERQQKVQESRSTDDDQFTIDDPKAFTRPWTGSLPMSKIDGPIFEYACHEGNYAMTSILAGARAQEKKATEEAAKKKQQ